MSSICKKIYFLGGAGLRLGGDGGMFLIIFLMGSPCPGFVVSPVFGSFDNNNVLWIAGALDLLTWVGRCNIIIGKMSGHCS